MLERALHRSALAILGSVLTLSCAAPTSEPSPFAIDVTWGLTGSSALPADVEFIDVLTCWIEDGDEVCESTNCSVNGLTLMTEVESCRPPLGTEMFGDEPVLVRRGLATDTPIRFFLRGIDGADVTTHIGMAGPFVLGTGERRMVNVTMWPADGSSTIRGDTIGRMLHTTSWLPDGRLLVAGGFDNVAPTPCPAAMMLAAGASCFDLTATDEAIAIDVGSGEVVPLRSSMLAPRGGHTATTLPDGRVLLAGGASHALFALVPMGGMMSGRFESVLVPRNPDGTLGAHDSFEVFDAFIGHQADDPDRDGDLGRGGFFGTNGTSNPGALNQPRFMHAATPVASTPGRVFIVGGMGGTDSARTWEVFDANKAGGVGVYRATSNMLAHARPQPGAVGLQGQVWIFGGRLAEDNEQLAEVWETDSTDPNGTVQLATDAGEFPSSAPSTPEDHPEYSLHSPITAAIDDGGRALVVGWYGAQCDAGSAAPRFFDSTTPGEFCNSPMSPVTRSFTVNGSSGITTATDVRPHSFGAVTEFVDFGRNASSRRVVVTGGIANATWVAQPGVDVFTSGVDSSGAATRLLGTGVSLQMGRFFHTSTGFPGQGVVTVGGASYDSVGGMLRLVSTIEIFFLAE